MKKPMNFLPILMMVSVVLIIMTLFTIQYTQPTKIYITESYVDKSKVNQPGPNNQKSVEQEAIKSEGINDWQIVLLKEDLRAEEEEPSIQLTNSTFYNQIDDEAFMNEMTKTESLSSTDGKDNYLIIAGTYTDDMMLLSKQAQYLNKGYSAEIIQFEYNTVKNICMGRFNDESQAETLVNEIKTKHDINAYVYHQAAESK